MKKIMPVILGVAFVGVMIFLLVGMGKFQGAPAEPMDLSMPEKWQEFTRTSFTDGKDAMGLFQKEHDKKVRFNQGAKADYADGKATFTVWVAPGSDEGNANQMVVEMSNKVGTTGKTFTTSSMLDLNGVTIFRAEGQGAVNYFYAKGRKVYWVAVKGGDADALIKRIHPDF